MHAHFVVNCCSLIIYRHPQLVVLPNYFYFKTEYLGNLKLQNVQLYKYGQI